MTSLFLGQIGKWMVDHVDRDWRDNCGENTDTETLRLDNMSQGGEGK